MKIVKIDRSNIILSFFSYQNYIVNILYLVQPQICNLYF